MPKPNFCLALPLTLIVSGCGFYSDLRLNNSVANYKATCFGSITNYCEYKLAKTNILTMKTFLKDIDRNKNDFIRKYGETGYEEIHSFAETFIAQQHEIKPSWFYKFFLSDAQAFRGGKNRLLSGYDMELIKNTFDKEFGRRSAENGNPGHTSEKLYEEDHEKVLDRQPTETFYQSSREYKNAYECAMQSLQDKYEGGLTGYCVGNSRDPSKLESQAFDDAQIDYSKM